MQYHKDLRNLTKLWEATSTKMYVLYAKRSSRVGSSLNALTLITNFVSFNICKRADQNAHCVEKKLNMMNDQ